MLSMIFSITALSTVNSFVVTNDQVVGLQYLESDTERVLGYSFENKNIILGMNTSQGKRYLNTEKNSNLKISYGSGGSNRIKSNQGSHLKLPRLQHNTEETSPVSSLIETNQLSEPYCVFLLGFGLLFFAKILKNIRNNDLMRFNQFNLKSSQRADN